MGHILKVFKNKKNNQLSVSLPRKELNLLDKDPISIEIKKIHMKLEKIKKKRLL